MSDMDKVYRKAWGDPAFKARLLSDPVAALRDAGIPVREGVTVKILEDTETVRHLVLPLPPPGGELTDDDLDGVSGGKNVQVDPPKFTPPS